MTRADGKKKKVTESKGRNKKIGKEATVGTVSGKTEKRKSFLDTGTTELPGRQNSARSSSFLKQIKKGNSKIQGKKEGK